MNTTSKLCKDYCYDCYNAIHMCDRCTKELNVCINCLEHGDPICANHAEFDEAIDLGLDVLKLIDWIVENWDHFNQNSNQKP